MAPFPISFPRMPISDRGTREQVISARLTCGAPPAQRHRVANRQIVAKGDRREWRDSLDSHRAICRAASMAATRWWSNISRRPVGRPTEINGPVRNPIISGRITSTSGTLNFRNVATKSRGVYGPAAARDDPLLNIEASRKSGLPCNRWSNRPLSQPQATVRSNRHCEPMWYP